jgi:small subunit ribosomal protein S17
MPSKPSRPCRRKPPWSCLPARTASAPIAARCVRALWCPTPVVVAVVERVRHPKYGKTVQRTKKLYVHDADDSAKVGDRVRVQETRPLSKLKRWRLTEVVERAR